MQQPMEESLAFSAGMTDAIVAIVFVVLWRLHPQTHLIAFGISFAGISVTLILSGIEQSIGSFAVTEPIADLCYLGALVFLVAGCAALSHRKIPWILLSSAGVTAYLIVRLVAQFGIPGVAYVPSLTSPVYAWVAYLFLTRRDAPGSTILGLLFSARAIINLAWAWALPAGVAFLVYSTDQIIVVASGLALIVTDLSRARKQVEAANAQLRDQAKALNALNAQLSVEREQADSANRAKSQFLANVSHELRTPLNAVIGFSEALTGQLVGQTPQRYAEYGEYIRSAGLHLLGIINDVLDMSRIEAGKVDLTVRSVSLRSVVQSAVTMTGHQAKARGIVFRAEIEDNADQIEADEQLLKQILINLLSNAFKFTAAGGTVRLSAEAGAEDRIHIVVEDNGIGIAPEDFVTIFEPFVARGSATTRRHGGMGLGLSITKRLIELHRGTIDIISEAGRGTMVNVVLPRHQTMENATEPAATTA
jgi:signal transduction histidine kinase